MPHRPACRMLARSALNDLENLSNATDRNTYTGTQLPCSDEWDNNQCMIPIAPKLRASAQAAGLRRKRCRTCGPVI